MTFGCFQLVRGLRYRILDRDALPPEGEHKVFALRPRVDVVVLYEARSPHAFELRGGSAVLWRREPQVAWVPTSARFGPSAFELCSRHPGERELATIGAPPAPRRRDAAGRPLTSGADYADTSARVYRVVRAARAWLAYEASYWHRVYELGPSWRAFDERDGRYVATGDEQPPPGLRPIAEWSTLPALVEAIARDRRTRSGR